MAESSLAIANRADDPAGEDPTGEDLFILVREHASSERPSGEGALVDWLLSQGSQMEDGAALFGELCWRMVAQGIPLWRANLSIGTLHPQIMGIGFRWRRDPGRTEEFRVKHGMTRRAAYLQSPMRAAIERGEPRRFRLDGSENIDDYPVLQEFRAEGATDYAVFPLAPTRFAGGHRVSTWATDRPGGFTDEHLAAIRALLPAMALVVESKAMQRVNVGLLDTYLGRTIGRHILEGEVQRGQGRKLSAALMATDLRGFTTISDRLASEELIRLLDDYFDAVVASVHDAGGEILKFVGDGVLAIFEHDGRSEREAAMAALTAAQEALRRLDITNENRDIVGQETIRMGIGLHVGEVIYGNVGATDRLDFTAIGPAVNLVCRLEGLTKRLGRPLLMSSAFQEAYGRPLFSLGFQPVKGLGEPQEVFALS